MSALSNIIIKELKELLTPATILPSGCPKLSFTYNRKNITVTGNTAHVPSDDDRAA